ncbi:MAG: hypothetical protein DMF06_08640 [Verrucomicrobia bacterium]|nr:MAG: hypothetical protein DMF06_08640 [Verrucomicrobiota bacterium]
MSREIEIRDWKDGGTKITERPHGEAPLSPARGSDADVISERRAALKFAQKWLWENPGRRTTGLEWPTDYLNDAASMLVDYRRKHQKP